VLTAENLVGSDLVGMLDNSSKGDSAPTVPVGPFGPAAPAREEVTPSPGGRAVRAGNLAGTGFRNRRRDRPGPIRPANARPPPAAGVAIAI
jgi:hypothetical protein